MSENSNNTKMIVNELKELKNSINTLNLILISSDIGINLKTHTNYEVNENLLPKYKNILKKINDWHNLYYRTSPHNFWGLPLFFSCAYD